MKGDMVVAGPRPGVPQQVERYAAHQRQRLRVKPGITGLAQVSGRSQIAWEERIELDIEYTQGWGLMRDLELIARTIVMVLTGKGTGLSAR